MNSGKCLATLIFIFNLCVGARADVRVAAVFSDNMVLQREISVPIWGRAGDGERITVRFRGQRVRAIAKNGKWVAKLSSLKAGGPDNLVIEGNNRLELTNVLVGEVWVCGGQSNMEFPLKSSFESDSDVRNSANSSLRLLIVQRAKANEPLHEIKGQWSECNPATSADFSAVAFYFGQALQKTRHVPIGLIDDCWGGTPAEVWISRPTLASNPTYDHDILQADSTAWKRYLAADPKPPYPPWRPAELYNGMLAPVIPYAIKGVIWYQGESNTDRTRQYRSLFPDLITNWRRDWGQGNFPFLAVQLAPFDFARHRSFEAITAKPEESSWAEIRETQLMATKILPDVGVAVITDVGEKDDIHPNKKELVGARLALAARGIAYGEKIEWSGPIYKKMTLVANKAIISFDHIGGGLEARQGELKGFAICGPDKQFVWANAKILGDKVVVESPQISKPVAVRFGWADFPIVNLWNKAGLPASPFRTDEPK